MTFKYQFEISHLSIKCPPQNYKVVTITAFRWIFDGVNNENNFQPLYFKNPKRANAFGDVEKCQSLGLSMFDSAENAIGQFNFLKARLGEMAYHVLGSSLAAGNINAEDGVADMPNNKGHFTFHPSETCIFEDRFQLISAL